MLLALLATACSRNPARADAASSGPARLAQLGATPRWNGCDPRFSMLLDGVAMKDIPGSSAMSVSADEATSRGVPCYGPGPHLDFNGARWCCKPGTPLPPSECSH